MAKGVKKISENLYIMKINDFTVMPINCHNSRHSDKKNTCNNLKEMLEPFNIHKKMRFEHKYCTRNLKLLQRLHSKIIIHIYYHTPTWYSEFYISES